MSSLDQALSASDARRGDASAAAGGELCPVCGEAGTERLFRARDYEHGVPGEWQVARCVRCGLLRLSPMPADSEFAAFYPATYSAYGSRTLMARLFRMVYRFDGKRIRSLIGPRGRILDIGCGDGHALREIGRYGEWQLSGIELNAEAAAKARADGLDVQQGDLASASFPDGSMRLIRMGHVIEHVPRPLETLRRIHALLEPGGVLYGETPNTDCADFRLSGKYWGALHLPRHCCLFDRDNLALALREAGFAGIEMAPRLRTVGWSCAIQNWLADRMGLPIPSTGRVSWYVLLILPFLPVTLLQSLSGRTGTVAFIARKPGGAPSPCG